jgi:chitin disaccharide deacetylase
MLRKNTEAFSTRFSTELLKTVTERSHFLRPRESPGGEIARGLVSALSLACYHFPPHESRLMKELILNADDFGLTRGVNEAVIRAHRQGILTSATLMANEAAFDDAVQRAKENPSLGVGVHLVLVGGRPVAPPNEIASLVDESGELPRSLGAFVARVTAGLIQDEHIQRELRAQIGKIRAAGIAPTHVDTHKHTHAHPRVMDSVARVARQFDIPRMRKPFESLQDSWSLARLEGVGSVIQLMGATAAQISAPRFDDISRQYGLRSPQRFLGLALTGQISAAVLLRMIDTLQEGATEIMLHPGICDSDLAATGSRLQAQRQTELDALLDPGLKAVLAQRDIRLISYAELN